MFNCLKTAIYSAWERCFILGTIAFVWLYSGLRDVLIGHYHLFDCWYGSRDILVGHYQLFDCWSSSRAVLFGYYPLFVILSGLRMMFWFGYLISFELALASVLILIYKWQLKIWISCNTLGRNWHSVCMLVCKLFKL